MCETGMVRVGACSDPGFGAPWGLLNVGYAGLDLIAGGKGSFSPLQRELEVGGAGLAERFERRCRRDGLEHGFHCR